MRWLHQIQSADWGLASWILVLAYTLGCITTGYYLVRWRTGQDLRVLGSGSVGARNAGRTLGWPGFLGTLLGDFGKGALAVWAARHFTHVDGLILLAILGVVAGHVWPAQLFFRGGKGMATSLGALLAYDSHLALAFAIFFLCGFVIFRRTVVPALVAFAFVPIASLYFGEDPGKIADPGRAVGLSVLAGLVLIAHRKNLIAETLQLMDRRTATKTR
jgi:glycerol-3-phosphate acyltransferase PlsY